MAGGASSHGKARRRGGAPRAILRVVAYFLVFLALTWVLTLVVGFVLGMTVGARLLSDEKGLQLLHSGWPAGIAAMLAIAILVGHWLRHR